MRAAFLAALCAGVLLLDAPAGAGDGGTAPDLLRLGRALLGPGLLSREAIEQMARQQIEGVPHIAEDGRVSYVEHGLGWRRAGGDWPPGAHVLTHGGQSGSRLWIDLERGFAFTFITNVWGVSSEVARASSRCSMETYWSPIPVLIESAVSRTVRVAWTWARYCSA